MNRLACLLAAVGLPALCAAQTGYTISGSMSNFDCTNRCDYETDEIEIQIEGIHPEDVFHTYRNGNYGSPTVTLSPDGGSTIIDYRNPLHPTQVGSIEHYGITIRGQVYYGPTPYHPTHVRWYRNGRPATVNGQVPVEGGGTAPATQPRIPTIQGNITGGSHGQGGSSLIVTNTDPAQAIWVQRSAIVTLNPVTLESLMPNDPVVTQTLPIDTGPVFVPPGGTLTLLNDFFEVEQESEQTVVFAARYFQNIVSNTPFFENQNTPGPELGNVMTATIATPQTACIHHPASIVEQPTSVTQAQDTRVDLRVRARGDDTSPLEYQWMKEGVPITDGNGFSGALTAHLRIDHLTAANEGFYNVRVVNQCISAVSDAALVFITGHNNAPLRAAVCAGDFNADGVLNPDDLGDFITCYFAEPPCGGADFNADAAVNPDDLGDFITVYFTGCP